MSATVKVFKNILALLSERVVVPAVNLLLVVLIARYLGADGLGRYAFVVGFVAFFDIFLDLGVNTLIVREVAKDHSARDRLASRAVTLKLAAAPVIVFLIFIFLRLYPQPPGVEASFYLFFASSMSFALAETFNSLYKSYERMNFVAFTVFVRQCALLVAVLAAMEAGWGIYGIAQSYFWVGLVYLVFSFALFNLKVDRVRIGIDRRFHEGLFRQSVPFITLGFFFLLIYRIDVVITSMAAGDVQAGFFSAASKVVSSVLLLSEAFLMAVFPILSRYEAGSEEKMRAAVRKSFHLLALVSFPIAVGLIVAARPALVLMYGPEFAGAAAVLAALSAALPLAYVSIALHFVLMARDRQLQSFYAIIAHVAALAGVVVWAAGAYGALGAALATLAVTASLFVFLGYMAFRDVGPSGALYELVRPFAASLVAGWAAGRAGLGLPATLALGLAVYAAAVVLLRGVDGQDLKYAREIWLHFAPGAQGGKGAK